MRCSDYLVCSYLFQTFPDNAIRRELNSMRVNCGFENCKWSGSFKEYEVCLRISLVLQQYWITTVTLTRFFISVGLCYGFTARYILAYLFSNRPICDFIETLLGKVMGLFLLFRHKLVTFVLYDCKTTLINNFNITAINI